jgi:hypothetical protein
MTEIWTVLIIFAALTIAYCLGFLTAGLLSSAYRSEIEMENQLLAGKNLELEMEIELLRGDKVLRFQSGQEEEVNNN